MCTAPSLLSAQNLLERNHSFTQGFEHWYHGTWEDEISTPRADFELDTTTGHDDIKSAKVTVHESTKDKPQKIFLRHQGLKLKKGKNYTFSFWVRSRVAQDAIKLLIYSAEETESKKGWGAVVDKEFEFFGDGQWKKMEVTFDAIDLFPAAPADFNHIGIMVGFGARKGIYHVDNFELVRNK